MAIFDPVPQGELGTRFKYRGWMWFCPIYFDDPEADEPCIVERNGVPEVLLTIAHWAQLISMSVLSMIDPDYEPAFMFTITGEIGSDT